MRHTLSKAWLMSINAAEHTIRFSKLSSITLTIWCTCSIVECCLRNLNWCCEIMRFSVNIDFSLFKSSLLNSFDKIGSSEIGLQEVTSLGSLPGFWMRMIAANFHWMGKCLTLSIVLYICVIATTPFLVFLYILLLYIYIFLNIIYFLTF